MKKEELKVGVCVKLVNNADYKTLDKGFKGQIIDIEERYFLIATNNFVHIFDEADLPNLEPTHWQDYNVEQALLTTLKYVHPLIIFIEKKEILKNGKEEIIKNWSYC